MPREIENSVVVITGASSGIGRAAALEFARQGATVVLAARRADALDKVAGQCEALGGQTLVVPTDVTDVRAVEDLARHAIETFGRIDFWINNAAVTLFGRIEEVPYEPYRRVIETNLLGYVHGARAAIPYFREQGAGVLVNVSSGVGKVGQPYTSAYVATKFAILGLSQCLRQELMDAPEIHVCAVLPPSVDTPLFQQAGNYTGRAVRPMQPIYEAHQVARAIVGAVESPRREVLVGTPTYLAAVAAALAPGYAEGRMAEKVEHEHFQDRPAEPSQGNLFEPLPQYASISGGWKEPSPVPTSLRVGAVAAGALAAIGLAAWWWTRPRDRDAFPGPRQRLRRVGLGT